MAHPTVVVTEHHLEMAIEPGKPEQDWRVEPVREMQQVVNRIAMERVLLAAVRFAGLSNPGQVVDPGSPAQ